MSKCLSLVLLDVVVVVAGLDQRARHRVQRFEFLDALFLVDAKLDELACAGQHAALERADRLVVVFDAARKLPPHHVHVADEGVAPEDHRAPEQVAQQRVLEKGQGFLETVMQELRS